MTEPSVYLRALEVARAQCDVLARGDVDAFIEGMKHQQQACEAIVAAGISDAEEAMVIDDLIAAVRESQEMLASLMEATSRRLGQLRSARTVAGAYLNNPAPTALSTHNA